MVRIAKWGTRLGAFDIRYRPRNSMKGQVLADFATEFSPRDEGEMVYHRSEEHTSELQSPC